MVICLRAISFDILYLLVSILILPEIIFNDRINSMKKKGRKYTSQQQNTFV